MGTFEKNVPPDVPQPPIYEKNKSHQIGLKPTSIERAIKTDHFSCKDLGIILIGSKVITLQSLDDFSKRTRRHEWYILRCTR